jgi:hypothetical protein
MNEQTVNKEIDSSQIWTGSNTPKAIMQPKGGFVMRDA